MTERWRYVFYHRVHGILGMKRRMGVNGKRGSANPLCILCLPWLKIFFTTESTEYTE